MILGLYIQKIKITKIKDKLMPILTNFNWLNSPYIIFPPTIIYILKFLPVVLKIIKFFN